MPVELGLEPGSYCVLDKSPQLHAMEVICATVHVACFGDIVSVRFFTIKRESVKLRSFPYTIPNLAKKKICLYS